MRWHTHWNAIFPKRQIRISDTYAIEAMRLIFSNLLTAYQQPDHADARHAMLYAAFLAVSVLQPLPQPRCMRLRIRWAESITFRMECRMRCYFLRLWSLIEASLQISSLYRRRSVYGASGLRDKEEAADAVIRQLYVFSRQMQIPTDLKSMGSGRRNWISWRRRASPSDVCLTTIRSRCSSPMFARSMRRFFRMEET